MKRAIFPAILFLMLMGCTAQGDASQTSALGLKSTGECDQLGRISERIECYHIAAITAAHLPGGNHPAQAICENIWFNFGLNAPTNDIKRRAELEANDCFFDVARITRDPEACGFISQQTSSAGLFGASTNAEMCKDLAGGLANLRPENFFRNNPNSMCNALFILPLVLLGSLLRKN